MRLELVFQPTTARSDTSTIAVGLDAGQGRDSRLCACAELDRAGRKGPYSGRRLKVRILSSPRDTRVARTIRHQKTRGVATLGPKAANLAPSAHGFGARGRLARPARGTQTSRLLAIVAPLGSNHVRPRGRVCGVGKRLVPPAFSLDLAPRSSRTNRLIRARQSRSSDGFVLGEQLPGEPARR